MGNSFFLVFFSTVLVARVFTFWFPIASPTIAGLRLHHYMYGIALVVIAVMVHSWPFFAVGFGLAVDEATFVLIGGKTHEDNYSLRSLAGTMLLVVVVFLLRQTIATFLS